MFLAGRSQSDHRVGLEIDHQPLIHGLPFAATDQVLPAGPLNSEICEQDLDAARLVGEADQGQDSAIDSRAFRNVSCACDNDAE